MFLSCISGNMHWFGMAGSYKETTPRCTSDSRTLRVRFCDFCMSLQKSKQTQNQKDKLDLGNKEIDFTCVSCLHF